MRFAKISFTASLTIVAMFTNFISPALALAPIDSSLYETFSGPSGSNQFADFVLREKIDGSFENYTDEAIDDATNDVMISNSENTNFYIGSDYQFDGVALDMSTPLTGGDFTVEYWDGDSWATLISSPSANIENSDEGSYTLTWTRPAAWAKTEIMPVTDQAYYFVRFHIIDAYSTQGKATKVGVLEYNFTLKLGNEAGLPIEDLDRNEEILLQDNGDGYDADGYIYADEEIDLGLGATLQEYRFALHIGGEHPDEPQYDYELEIPGYVSTSFSNLHLQRGSSTVVTLSNLRYAHRIKAVDENDRKVDIDSFEAGSDNLDCDIHSGEAYCAVPYTKDGADETLNIDGFVEVDFTLANRDSNSDNQQYGTVEVDYTYIAILEDEDGDEVEGADVSFDSGNVDCEDLGDGRYGCAIPHNERDLDIDVEFDDKDYSFEFDAIRLRADSNQVVETFEIDEDVSNNNNDDYRYIAIIEDEDGERVRDAEVSYGDDFEEECEELGNGEYGCEIYSYDDLDIELLVDGDVQLFEFDERYDNDQVIETFEWDGDIDDRDDDDDKDSDDDGLSDDDEDRYGTDEDEKDTDDDDVNDYYEVEMGSDPLDDESYFANWKDVDKECDDDPFVDTYFHYAEKSICLLYEEEIVEGKDRTHYSPSSSITRAEFLKMALEAADEDVDGVNRNFFSDVKSYDWHYDYVTYAADEGYVEGFGDGTFRPNGFITRQDALLILMRIAGEDEDENVDKDEINFWDVDTYDYFAYSVVTADKEGIMQGYSDGSFGVNRYISRGEVAEIIRRAQYVYFGEE